MRESARTRNDVQCNIKRPWRATCEACEAKTWLSILMAYKHARTTCHRCRTPSGTTLYD
uniref:Uncharacterized protein n=1 Tax=Cucumis melo TaxID=3656 RepID=A0A9I9DS43_CUCME